jgi:hypothetical protein
LYNQKINSEKYVIMNNSLTAPAVNGDPSAGLKSQMYAGELPKNSDLSSRENSNGGVTVLGPVNESDEFDVPDFMKRPSVDAHPSIASFNDVALPHDDGPAQNNVRSITETRWYNAHQAASAELRVGSPKRGPNTRETFFARRAAALAFSVPTIFTGVNVAQSAFADGGPSRNARATAEFGAAAQEEGLGYLPNFELSATFTEKDVPGTGIGSMKTLEVSKPLVRITTDPETGKRKILFGGVLRTNSSAHDEQPWGFDASATSLNGHKIDGKGFVLTNPATGEKMSPEDIMPGDVQPVIDKDSGPNLLTSPDIGRATATADATIGTENGTEVHHANINPVTTFSEGVPK